MAAIFRALLRHPRRVGLVGRRADRLRLPGRLGGRDGKVVEIEPGARVTMVFHPRWSPEIEAEGPVRMTWAVEPAGNGVSKLTVVTSGMTEGGVIQGEFAGGIVSIVSGLKTYLETGEPMTAVEAEAAAG